MPNILDDIKSRMQLKTDICEHLLTIFDEGAAAAPRCIVELGVRDGESTRVLWELAKAFNGKLISVDHVDCHHANPGDPDMKHWKFVEDDSVRFGQRWGTWCTDNLGSPWPISLLFVDTCHLYEITRRELAVWLPRMEASACLMFHDTNQKNGNTGVQEALEFYLDAKFDWKRPFVDYAHGYIIKHWPNCDGFTVLRTMHPCLPRWEWAEYARSFDEDSWGKIADNAACIKVPR